MKDKIYSVCKSIFGVTVPIFMLLGFVIVVVQFIFGLLGIGEPVLKIGGLELYATWVSTFTGLLAYFATYFALSKKPKE